MARQALAESYRLPSAYDAHYLALAEGLEAELYTSDLKLVEALKVFDVEWVRSVYAGRGEDREV